MRLAVRLWLFGAVIPFLGTVAALLVAGQLFRAKLERKVDEALLGQAAVEAVSLFDGPAGSAHLHLAKSPLREKVRFIAPAATLFEPDGTVELRHPRDTAEAWNLPFLDPVTLPADPQLETVVLADGTRVRRLTMPVYNPHGGLHALQLAASLAGLDASVGEFHRTGVAMALALGAGLFVLQSFFAHRLRARVTALTAHMAALREGNLDAVPPTDAARDEIAELSRVVAAATDQLRRARAAQDRLVAEAAHELRTPLTLMRTSMDLALRRERGVAELVASLEETRREVDRLAHLATRLLAFATAGRGEWDRTPGDLVTVAAEAAEAARSAAEQKGVLIEVHAPAPAPATFDVHGVRQAVDNLLANAIRFSPHGGVVRVEVTCDDGLARLVVQDDGPGIPPADRERVFAPFQRGQERKLGGEGAGLGLAIVRTIARGHGGRAYAESVERGARVVIELPVGTARRATA